MVVIIPKPGHLSDTEFPRSSSPKISFGQLIRSVRICNEGQANTFAKKLGISLTELLEIEEGKTVVSKDKAIDFAAKLNADPEIFLRHL